ncbi:MAG: flagellar biosynthesis protein FlhA [Gemmobacter sp.]
MPKLTLTLRDLFRPTILLALALMTVIVMMILPVPAWFVDIGLAASFALAILMFTVTLFIERPLDFSAFPTVLLASLLLRLSLSISSTKLIIGQGHSGTDAAGQVIEAFASFIMGGSVVLGVVIFCILLIVNFIVITKGAGRMAEVGARFALDGMPGKQLAIDSDMSAGAIDHAEARARREREQAETNFFGSLDGVSKFVKGDAVAGLLITLLTMVMGLVLGVVVHGMPLGRAFETYAILTVGDGLVNQIPAVIISVAAALLLARGGATGATDMAVFSQLGRYPAALGTVAVLMALFGLVPGLPMLPFLAGAAALGAAAMLGASRPPPEDVQAAEPPAPRQRPIGDVLDFDEIHVEFAPDLVPMVLDPATGLDARIASIRNHVAASFGLILPEIRLTDEAVLPPGHYRIRIQGVEQARDRLCPGRVLVLPGEGEHALPEGEDVSEPVYGAPARWIAADRQEEAVLAGLTTVTPAEVLATHLLEVMKSSFARLLTLKGLRRLLDEFANLSDPVRAAANRRLLDELIPDRVPVDLLLAVLRLLLEERVSVRNLPLILEAIAELRGTPLPPEAVCEHVRRRLGFQIVAGLKREDGTIPLVQLAPEWEQTFARYQIEGERGVQDVALPPEQFNRLADALGERLTSLSRGGAAPALVTSALRRRFLRTVLGTRGLPAPVLSYDEIGTEARPALLGMIPA